MAATFLSGNATGTRRALAWVCTVFIAAVWVGNGLYAKVLNLVPRHQEIVGRILGHDYSRPLTVLIGLSEIALGLAVLTRLYARPLVYFQIVLVLTMNIIERMFAVDLLLHGDMNLVYAVLFCLFLFIYARFILDEKWSLTLADLLPKHAFAVKAYFDQSIVLTYAIPRAQLEPLIPAPLQLDTHGDVAFVAVALVRTRELRPSAFPRIMGNDFILIGYRIFVRYTNKEGKRLRGLFILRSETDKRKMVTLGNLMTKYHYSLIDIDWNAAGGETHVSSQAGKFSIAISRPENPALPAGSPFADWKEARRFAGPLPFSFSMLEGGKRVIIVKGMRENWTPAPIQVDQAHVGFLSDNPAFAGATLANAFIVENIPYEWSKGVIEDIS